jgi:type IV pilus assembly protein PilQ
MKAKRMVAMAISRRLAFGCAGLCAVLLSTAGCGTLGPRGGASAAGGPEIAHELLDQQFMRRGRMTLDAYEGEAATEKEASWAYLPPSAPVPDGLVRVQGGEAEGGGDSAARAAGRSGMQAERLETVAEEASTGGGGADVSSSLRPLPTVAIEEFQMARPVALGAFLTAMGKLADQNVFYSDKLTGDVQFELSSASTWDSLFRTLLRTHSLTYGWEGDILCVYSQEDLQRGLSLEQLREQQRSVESARLRVEPLQLCTIRIRYADAKSIRDQLEPLLTRQLGESGMARGSVQVDAGNNAVVINAVEEDIRKMMALVDRLDRSVAQVLIEAHIVEANRDTARQLGIQWGGAYSGVRDGVLYATTAGGNPDGFMADFPAELTGAGFTIGGTVDWLAGSQMLNAQLSALEEKGQLHILSSPSITTLDNQMAFIESGKEVPYRVLTGTGDARDFTTEWKKALLRLEVTPSVIDQGLIKLKINTTKDELDDTVTVDGLPRVITKRAETTLILRNGQTTVIGGLSRQYERDSRSGIPFLGRIPLLGALFRSSDVGTSLEDLLIFITPRMLSDHESMRADEARAGTARVGVIRE